LGNELVVYITHIFSLKFGCLLFALSLITSCKEGECEDVDYGRQYMSDTTRSSFAYQGGETLIFIDSTGQELSFRVVPFIGIYPDWLNYEQGVTEGPCVGERKIKCEIELFVANIRSDTLDYDIVYVHRVHSLVQGIAPIFYDIMTSDMSQGNESPVNWRISTKHLLDPKGNEEYLADNPIEYDFTELITLNGKTFENVYFNLLPDGSALYFNHELGFVGFKERSKSLWVLDRIE
jgi:hypothetical protein